MRRIFPSILSPASGESLQKDDHSHSSSAVTQDKECVTAVRQKSPARSRSPFKWGRSSTPRGDSDTRNKSRREHYCPKCPADGKGCETPPSGDENAAALAAVRRLAHPGRSIEQDLASPSPMTRNGYGCGYEDDCEEKQVLSVRACSPTAYFQSAHRMRAVQESETKSTAESRYRANNTDLALVPTQHSRHEAPGSNHSKRTKSAPRLRMPFGGDAKSKIPQQRSMRLDEGSNDANSSPALTMLSNLVTHWQSPGRTRNGGHNRTDSADNLSVVSTSGSNSFGERRERALVEYDEKAPYRFQRDSEKPQVKYRAARSVAEKFAKAIRGGSKSSPKDAKPSAAASFSESSGVNFNSSFKDSTRALQSYLNDPNVEVDSVDYSSEIVLEFPSRTEQRYIYDKDVFPLARREAAENEKECEDLDNQLKDYSAKVDNMFYRAQERAIAAEQQAEVVRAELDALVQSFLSDDSDSDDGGESTAVHTKIRNLLQQKLNLATEAASEAKVRVSDQETVRNGLALMKRRLHLATVVSERQKTELQTALEEELQRREAEWIARLEKAQMEETRLKGRVRDIAENNVGLQKETASMAAREKGLRDQIRQYEDQLAAHKKKLDETEKVMLEIRESSVSSRKDSRNAEAELASARKRWQEKEEENMDLRRLVARLQQLCTDHEKSIQGLYNGLKNVTDSRTQDKEKAVAKLQQELCRLSTIEQSLRRDLEVSNREATALRRELKRLMDSVKMEKDGNNGVKQPGSEYHSEIDRLKTQIYELHEQNTILSIKFSTAQREEKAKADAVREMESRKRSTDDEVKILQDEIGKWKMQLQDKEKDFKWVETRLQAVVKTNRLLQGIVAKQATFKRRSNDLGGEDEAQCELQKCLEVSAEQLNQMSERLELMKDKLLERESELFAARTDCGKKDVTIQGLEQYLAETKKSLETRIQRLTGRNEELFRLYNAKEKELVDLQTRVKQETDARKKCEGDLEQVKEQLTDLQEELKVQGMHCVLLRDKLCTREVEMEHQDAETKKSVEDSYVLKKDTAKLQSLLDEATQRVIGLEHKLAEKEEKLTWLQRGLNDRVQDWTKVKEELVRTRKERDQMKQEAEELGREALRAGAEVEVLRRRVNLLEEDILLKEGELSILHGDIEE